MVLMVIYSADGEGQEKSPMWLIWNNLFGMQIWVVFIIELGGCGIHG